MSVTNGGATVTGAGTTFTGTAAGHELINRRAHRGSCKRNKRNRADFECVWYGANRQRVAMVEKVP